MLLVDEEDGVNGWRLGFQVVARMGDGGKIV